MWPQVAPWAEEFIKLKGKEAIEEAFRKSKPPAVVFIWIICLLTYLLLIQSSTQLLINCVGNGGNSTDKTWEDSSEYQLHEDISRTRFKNLRRFLICCN